MAKKVRVPVVRMEQLEEGIYDLIIREEEIAALAKPGQFLSLYLEDSSRLLPRPISICGINKEEHTIRMVFRVAGEGTRQLSMLTAGDSVEVMGPLGNGFYDAKLKTAIVIGGGIGIPPMLELAKRLDCEKTIVLGYRDELFLTEDFAPYGKVVLASEDGRHGTKGNVLDAIREQAVDGDVIYACGPIPMLRAIKEYGLSNGMEVQISMEEKMACGIGACLACVCNSTEVDGHSYVKNKRICKDGPVFFAEEVEL